MSGTLHLVALPIGNPADISLRALKVLRSVSVVAAEDTRHFATLARHHGLETRSVSYHDHNEEARVPQLMARLAAGEDVALVSDAGTPLVSDPGYRLDAFPDAFQVTRIGGHLLALVFGTDVPGEGKQHQGHGHEDAENQAEIIEEMRVLLAHGREVYRSKKWRARQDSNL